MKRFTKIILGLSLMASSSLLANNTLSILYSLEDNDSLAYTMNNEYGEVLNNTVTLSEQSISNETIVALYPVENDDNPDYLFDSTSDNKNIITYKVASKSSLSSEEVCAIYPEENLDSPRSC